MPAVWYPQAPKSALAGNIKIGTNTIKAGLLKSTYTPANADTLWSDVSGNESTGTNYTAGGIAVTSPVVTETAANSWGTAAATTTAYSLGQVVRPATGNGFVYMVETAGTSGGTAPTWPTVFGATVTDGTVTWTNIGTSIVSFSCSALSWTNLTSTDFEYIVFYDSVTGALIARHDLGSAQNVVATNVTYTPDAAGVCYTGIA